MFGIFWSTLAGAYLSDSDNSNSQSGGGCLFSIILFVILFFSEDIRDGYEEAWEVYLASVKCMKRQAFLKPHTNL